MLRTLGAHAWFGTQLYVAGASQVFDAEGKLVDEEVRELLTDLVTAFAAFLGS